MTSEQATANETQTASAPAHNSGLLPVDEGLHVLNPDFVNAVRDRQPEILGQLIRKRVGAGARGLAVNLGPSRHLQDQTEWLLKAVTAETDVPLFLSSNIINSEHILEQYGRRITINAVTADRDGLAHSMEVARRFDTGLVVLLVAPDLVPCGVNDRIILAATVLEAAAKTELHPGQLYLDPVLGCRPDPFALAVSRGVPDLGTVVETLALIKELHPDVRTILGLGNGAIGVAGRQKSAQYCRMLQILASVNLDAAVIDCLDEELMEVVENINRSRGVFPALHHNAATASVA